jgi:hypothetical protein
MEKENRRVDPCEKIAGDTPATTDIQVMHRKRPDPELPLPL